MGVASGGKIGQSDEERYLRNEREESQKRI